MQVFGRGGEEMDFLQEQGIQVQVVPGMLTSMTCFSRCIWYRWQSSRVVFVGFKFDQQKQSYNSIRKVSRLKHSLIKNFIERDLQVLQLHLVLQLSWEFH